MVNEDGHAQSGEYVVGWIKRGPWGVIGTHKKDAADTVAKMLEDRDAGTLNTPTVVDPAATTALFAERAPDAVAWASWQAIESAEKAAGEPHRRPRIKLTRVADLVDSARGTTTD